MDVYEAITLRKSVRSYEDRPVEEEKLKRIFSAARLAPSASNRQEWRFVLVTDKTFIGRLAEEGANQAFLAEAPVIIACCAETDGHNMKCGLPCFPIDVAIAVDHITLCAAAEGLGTCWIGAFDPETVKKILGIPAHIRVVELLALGYPKDPSAAVKMRKPMDDILFRNAWKR
ncbi:MAG: nitroreductase [Spirochaetales bacterium]|nr:MAG: nitroreductase [Spirochaetales bacterium]